MCTVWSIGCSQPPPEPSAFTFDEPAVTDTGRSNASSADAGPSETNRDVDPASDVDTSETFASSDPDPPIDIDWRDTGYRIEPASKHPWSPKGRPVWFHTLEESLKTYDRWKQSIPKGVYRPFYSHLWFSPIGPDRSGLEGDLAELSSRIERHKNDLGDRGVFWGIGPPLFADSRYTHVFECLPRMPVYALYKRQDPDFRIGKGYRGKLTRRFHHSFAWVVGNKVVECIPHIDDIKITYVDPDTREPVDSWHLPEEIEQWLAEIARTSRTKVDDRSEYPSLMEYYYLEPSERAWKRRLHLRFSNIEKCYRSEDCSNWRDLLPL